MFWFLLLCHFIGDYPLQTDGMVKAKKQIFGLTMHVFIHFVTLLVFLSAFIKLETSACIILALSVSFFHFAIDYWKNILSQLRPSWIIFSYIQDQILHLISLFLVSFLYYKYNGLESFNTNPVTAFYITGLILSTHFWFITERVFSIKNPIYLQWTNTSMWPRMMSRGMLYGILFTGISFSSFVLFTGSIVVVWNDLNPEKRTTVLTRDLGGVMILMCLTWLIGQQIIAN